MKKYVIIGNGAAAVSCIEGIRSRDDTGEITVISEEDRPVYCRPLISYYLEDKTDAGRMNYRAADFYEKNGCRVLYGHRAAAIDPAKKTVTAEDGRAFPYDALCIASGASPAAPPLNGLDAVREKYFFTTLDDAEKLKAAVKRDTRVLILGAGLIGLKCAEGCRALTTDITVCNRSKQILSRILDADAAGIVRRHMEKNGVRFLLGCTDMRFEGNRMTAESAAADFDVLVLALGTAPNMAPFKAAGGETGRGILVNERLETSLPGVYAAGDCAEGLDASSGERKIMALMPIACMQGYTAGVNMAGGDRVYDDAFPINSFGFFGLHAMTAGTCGGDMYEERDGEKLKRLFMKDGRLCGFILVGYTARAGIYTSLIREKTPLDALNFELLKKTATTAAFPEAARRKKFGGVV